MWSHLLIAVWSFLSLFVFIFENNIQFIFQENWMIEKGKWKTSSDFNAEILAYVEVKVKCYVQFEDNPFVYYMNLWSHYPNN